MVTRCLVLESGVRNAELERPFQSHRSYWRCVSSLADDGHHAGVEWSICRSGLDQADLCDLSDTVRRLDRECHNDVSFE
jgi:hypothetical protein